jgi:aryl-alcohol dehydrogenase-like predicted oxidoreductase
VETIALGRSGLRCSAIGLGCMGMSEFYGDRDDEQSLRTLARAHDLGVTQFDTADIYGRGHNETLLSRFIRDKRDRIVLSSKFGIVRDPDGPNGSTYDRGIDNTEAYLRRCCEASLKRLGTDAIDLYYVHRTHPDVPIEDTIGALARLVSEGKIRAIGLSEITADQLRRAHRVYPIAALQSEYSLWTREPELEVLPACRELGVTFVAYSPLGRGFLTGAIASAQALDPSDFRLTSPRFREENFDRNRQLLERLNGLAQTYSCTLGQLALAWLLGRDPAVLPIPGTKRIRYLEENVGAVDVRLDAHGRALLEEWLPIGAAAGTRYDPSFAGAPKAPKEAR